MAKAYQNLAYFGSMQESAIKWNMPNAPALDPAIVAYQICYEWAMDNPFGPFRPADLNDFIFCTMVYQEYEYPVMRKS